MAEKEKLPDGVRAYTLADGKRRYQYRVIVTQSDGSKKLETKGGFTTKTAAAKARREKLTESDQGQYADPGNYTVGTWLEEWLSGSVNLKDKQRDFYRYLIKLYVTPYVGAVPLGQLTSTRIGRLMNELRDHGRQNGEGVSNGTARLVFAMLRVGLQAAVDREPALLAANPADRNRRTIKPGVKRARSVEWWTPEQLGAFLAWARERAPREDFTFWQTVAMTGMRKDEAMSLRWRHVHLQDGFISVEKPKGGEGRKRNVPFKGGAAETLAEYKAHRLNLDRKLAAPSALVFGDENGEVPTLNAVTRRFNRAVARCRRELGLDLDELPQLHGIHGLRHTCASILIMRRVPLTQVAEILGHSVRILSEVYAHIIPPPDGYGAGDVMAEILASPQASRAAGIELALEVSQAG